MDMPRAAANENASVTPEYGASVASADRKDVAAALGEAVMALGQKYGAPWDGPFLPWLDVQLARAAKAGGD